MICDPCKEAADAATWTKGRYVFPLEQRHDPAICRDAAIQPHGCACAHGQRNATEGNGT